MNKIFLYTFVMAAVTYLIRMLPLVLFKKEITSTFVKSFLYYVPYACLAAMTFPAILGSTSCLISAIIGFVVAAVLAFFRRSMILVSLCACGTVFIVEQIIRWIG
ncbi:MAG: AzlD domain-containing protein [Lachnospiraceae bacterium]|nr:AzlD domain-containing protein [Clostridia bacterium]MBQ9814294.1 AzlD domain-containing protein [Lachnospiraceae bacterium]MBR3003526.1 AzlD domain-containing protein [Lachnospiraceae bacterium]MBR6349491.1 AzlD domain-containing protein [Lachnospiraceae bacterium]